MKHKRGFTLVELNLAILFVALLVLGVAMTTIYLTRIYQRGLTVRTINQIGRDVNGQLRRDIAAAKPSAIVAATSNPNSGRICLGNISYVYNTAQGIAAGDVIGGPDASTEVFLVRINDVDGQWCQTASGPGGGYVKQNVASSDEYTELLSNDSIPLAVHRMKIVTHEMQADVGLQNLYSLTIELGTNEAGTTSGGRCRPPSQSQANFDYCFIAEFETVIRAGEVPI